MNRLGETIRADLAGQPQILLMEDEPSVAQGLRTILSDEGYVVDLAITGQGALDTMNHKNFDLLVADLRLPDMDGMDVVKRIKDESPETDVIVITGYATIPSAVEAMKNGVGDYLPKPFTDDEFKEAVTGILKGKKGGSAPEKMEFFDSGNQRLIHKKEVIRALRVVSNSQGSGIKAKNHIAEFAEFDTDEDTFAASNHFREWRGPDKKMAEQLNLNKDIVENAVEGIMGCDIEGNIIIFNKSLEKMLGYSHDEVIGKMSFDQFFLVGGAEQLREELHGERYGGKNRLFLFETDLVHKSGEKVPVRLSANLLFEKGVEIGMAAFLSDTADIRRIEQEFADQARLLHQDKMMSLGRLAASVVHEINNPLAGILNYIRLMIRVLGRPSSLTPETIQKFQSYLTLVESETDRCSKIVSNLLAFSRKSRLEFGELNICEILKKCIMLSRHKLELQNIRIQTHLDPTLPYIFGDFNQIQQCIINLIFNAVDAMPEGGVLTVCSSSASSPEGVEITIQDTGCGISEENLSSIFEPFFSTKKEGEGLGLGLSTVLGIIDRHGGTIKVDSELGKGTVFKIQLPAVKNVI
jgi:PAS domain S-box-containing protein